MTDMRNVIHDTTSAEVLLNGVAVQVGLTEQLSHGHSLDEVSRASHLRENLWEDHGASAANQTSQHDRKVEQPRKIRRLTKQRP